MHDTPNERTQLNIDLLFPLVHHPGVVLAKRRIRRVFRS